jgi:hypothetical protein
MPAAPQAEAAAAAPAAPAAPSAPDAALAPLAVTTVSAAQAQAVLTAAVKKATEIKIPQNIVVMDPAGHLVAFLRMDGAPLVSIDVAHKKARTVALFGGRFRSGDLKNGELSVLGLRGGSDERQRRRRAASCTASRRRTTVLSSLAAACP